MLMTYDGGASTAEKLTEEELEQMGKTKKRPELKIIKGGNDNNNDNDSEKGFFDDDDNESNKDLIHETMSNEELARQRREQKEQDELDELNFLLSVNKPKDTAKRLVQLADKAIIDRKNAEKKVINEKIDTIKKVIKEQADTAELAEFEETLMAGANAEKKLKESQEQEVDLTNEAELVELTEHPQAVEEIDEETENYNEEIVDFVQKQLGTKKPNEIENNLINFLIDKEFNNPRGEFANQELRATLGKLEIHLPSETELNKILIKKEKTTSADLADKYLEETDEEIENRVVKNEKDTKKDEAWIDAQNKKINGLGKNDHLNFETLHDLRDNNDNNQNNFLLFANFLNGLTKKEQAAIVPLLQEEENYYGFKSWTNDWLNSKDRKFSPELSLWEKLKRRLKGGL